ncbi:MAG: hypothetical protein AAGG56_11585 [Pseudomonadota bacterium]
MPLMILRSSTRRAPGWFLGNNGSMAGHARSESQNSPAIIQTPLIFSKRIRASKHSQHLD